MTHRHLGEGDKDSTEEVPQRVEDGACHRGHLEAGSHNDGEQAVVGIVQQRQQDVQCVPPELGCTSIQPSANIHVTLSL